MLNGAKCKNAQIKRQTKDSEVLDIRDKAATKIMSLRSYRD
jgi:hypothetical protein